MLFDKTKVIISFPNKKISELSRLEKFEDHNSILAEMMRFIFVKADNIVEKGKTRAVTEFDLIPHQCYASRVRTVVRHCRKMRQRNKCGARFFHLAKVHGDNFLSSNLNSTY